MSILKKNYKNYSPIKNDKNIIDMNLYYNYNHMKNNNNYNSMENNNNIMSYNDSHYDKYYINKSKVYGIKNKENNCYLNSGLQILASCNELVDLINHYHYYLKTKLKIF